ncbi:MAG: hypothetical protein R3F55_10475 [Alphaproteobacteria bacterium]
MPARPWRALAGLTAAVLAVLAAVTAAPALDLLAGESAAVAGVEISYIRDPDGTLDLAQALAAYDAGAAQPLGRQSAEFGHAFDSFWLFVAVANRASAPAAGMWRRAPRSCPTSRCICAPTGATRSCCKATAARPLPHGRCRIAS